MGLPANTGSGKLRTSPLEILFARDPNHTFHHAVLDFDGTISLIREGWQAVMTQYFVEELLAAPLAKEKDKAELEHLAKEFITLHTGKQTIYQCIALAEEVEKLGGKPADPQDYKDEYHRRLLERIEDRRAGLENGTLNPEPLMVPGSEALLQMLTSRGVKLYLASGTDEHYVLEEAAMLGVDKWFEGRIYGAQRDYKTFSKKMVIQRIIRENSLHGPELLGFGDGYVEIENVVEAGGYAVGVASDESRREGIDPWKRDRLAMAGAHMIIPDYRDIAALEQALFGA